ncbi:MAG TPA: transposase [Gaiellaceae bacterium]|nr:transposase [Gaiellaceae bacterium]
MQFPGQTFHVTQHGIGSTPIFPRARDCETFLRYLREEMARSSWVCLGYALMRTHYHLLIRLEKPTLSSGFQRLNSRYAAYYNREHGRRGAFFERRYRAVLIESAAHRFEALRYIHLNALRAKACKRPEDHVWCDFGATMGLLPPDPIVDPEVSLAEFGEDLDEARRRYGIYLREADVRVRRGQTRV